MPAWNASNWIVKHNIKIIRHVQHIQDYELGKRRSAAVLVRGAAESARERQGTVGQGFTRGQSPQGEMVAPCGDGDQDNCIFQSEHVMEGR